MWTKVAVNTRWTTKDAKDKHFLQYIDPGIRVNFINKFDIKNRITEVTITKITKTNITL